MNGENRSGAAVLSERAMLSERTVRDRLSPEAVMVELLRGPLAYRHTLLAVCPNSEAVIRAGLRAAHRAGSLLLAATLNQVDLNGGYPGWTPATFIAYLQKAIDRLEITVPVIAARAARLKEHAAAVGALIKGHYTDGVSNPEEYPLSGMGGANVGPGFSAVEYEASQTPHPHGNVRSTSSHLVGRSHPRVHSLWR